MIETLKYLVRQEYGDDDSGSSSSSSGGSRTPSSQLIQGEEECLDRIDEYQQLEKDVNRLINSKEANKDSAKHPPGNKALQRISSRASSFDSNPGSPFQVRAR